MLNCLAQFEISAFMMAPTRMEPTMRKPTDNRPALDAFLAKKVEIDTMLARLLALSDEHFD